MALPPGHQLGPYEILAQLGEGGIKTSKSEFTERFEREASDSRRVLVSQPEGGDQPGPPMVIIQNWAAGLPKQPPLTAPP